MQPANKRPPSEAQTWQDALAILDYNTHHNPGEDACWTWVGTRWRGQGRIKAWGHDGSRVWLMAHRVSFERHLGRPLSCFEDVVHDCAEVSCVNPHHLRLEALDDALPDPPTGHECRLEPDVPAARQRRPGNMVTTDEQAAEGLALYFGPDGDGSAARMVRPLNQWVRGLDLAAKYKVSVPHMKRVLWDAKATSHKIPQGELEKARALYYGPDGIGSVSEPKSEHAKWRSSGIAKHLGISIRSFEKIRLGLRYRHLPRPAHAPPLPPLPPSARAKLDD